LVMKALKDDWYVVKSKFTILGDFFVLSYAYCTSMLSLNLVYTGAVVYTLYNGSPTSMHETQLFYMYIIHVSNLLTR